MSLVGCLIAALTYFPLFAALKLGLQDAVFGGKIFVPRQQLLVYRPHDVGQDARPIHNGPFARSDRRTGVIDRPKKCNGPPPEPLCWPWITDRLLGRFSFLTIRGLASLACSSRFCRTPKADIRFQRNICRDGPLSTFCIAEKTESFCRSLMRESHHRSTNVWP